VVVVVVAAGTGAARLETGFDGLSAFEEGSRVTKAAVTATITRIRIVQANRRRRELRRRLA
jgi:hypothetical protein